MLLRLILLLTIAGGLTVFTVQNLTPLLPLVFLGIQFPALPLSWWVLGAMGAGVASMLTIQGLIGLSNFVTGQTVRSRVRASTTRSDSNSGFAATADPDSSTAWQRQSRRERSTTRDDTAWQDWRGYESPSTQTASRATPSSVDDWERPPSDDWETPPRPDSSRRAPQDRVTSAEPKADREKPPQPTPRSDSSSSSRSDSSYSYSGRDPQDIGVGKSEKVVDADYRVIVPPYRPLDEPIPPVYTPPPPPVVEENADDWFEETSDDFGDPKPPTTPA